MSRVAVAVLAVALVLSGCLGGLGIQSPGESGSAPLPSPPEQVNESAAESFALEYERVRLVDRLRESYGNDSFGVDCCTAPRSASTVAEQSGVYYVYVQYPYYYETADAETDAATEAVYAVSGDGTTRIDLRGRAVSVDDPYSAPNHSENGVPPRLYLVNAASDGREVALTLTHLGESKTAFERDVELGANASMEVNQLALRKGAYRLTVSTGGQTVEHRFAIDGSGGGPTVVLLTDDGTVIRRTEGTPNESVAV